ncbi:MAG: pyruvate dehydrogenase complex dihydrolipoamide acetyltransferase [Alphaproteobacteria bacterium]
MPIQILMPALSPTMEEGKLAKWLIKEGDEITSGKIIAEIETDKATMEVEAVEEGTVGRILVAEGTEGVAVNAPIAVLLAEGEDKSALDKPLPAPVVASASQSSATRTAGASSPSAASSDINANGHAAERMFASPVARRLASEKGIDLRAIKGSGPHGRIVRSDVEEAAASGSAKPAVSPGQALVPSNKSALSGVAMPDNQIIATYEQGSFESVPHDNMRKTIAARLVQAKQSIPHFYLTIDCELDALLEARQRLNMRSPKDEDKAYRLSVNDFIIKAMGLALRRVPKANATWTEENMLYHKHSDVAVAVAVEGGLFTPVIRNVESKSLVEISRQMRDLADRARRRRLAPHEYQGGTTAISNLGMFGIRQFDAVINPPQATILAVGQGEKRPVVKGDKIVAVTMMTVTLSCDHRVVDGALGAQLLSAFKSHIEEPVTMLL